MGRAALICLAVLLWPAASWGLESACVTAPDAPRALAVLDVDGDLDLDIALATTDGVLLLINDGEGLLSFLREASPGDDDDSAGGQLPPLVRLGPGRGFLDVAAVARTTGDPMELLALDEHGFVLGFGLDPAGGFPTTWTAKVGSALAFAWADLDGDGDMDVALGTESRGLVVLGASDDELTALYEVPELGPVTDVAWAQLDDGRLGLAVGVQDAGRVYAVDGTGLQHLGTTTPAIEPGAERVVWQDRDGDGQPEAIFGGTLETLEPLGSGVTRQLLPIDEDAELGPLIAVASTYLVTSGTSGDIAQILRSTNAGGADAWEVAYEVNRSARGVDLVVAELDTGVLSIIAAGIFSGGDQSQVCTARIEDVDPEPPLTWPLPPELSFLRAVGLGDADRDGRPDAALIGSGVAVVLRNEEGGFGATELLRATGIQEEGRATFQDLDGDGYPELLVGFKGTPGSPFPLPQGTPAVPAEPAVMIFRNDAGLFDPTAVWTHGSGTEGLVTAADVDGDGLLDLLVGIKDGIASIRRGCIGEQGPCFDDEPAWQSQADLHPTSMAWGDLDGDRDLDLAIQTNQGGLHIFENRSDPESGIELVAAAVFAHANEGTDVHWVDWNGDGAVDLLAGTTVDIQLYRNVAGALEPAWISPGSMATGGVRPLDWDADGDMDLVVDTLGDDVRIYLQDPTGPTFGPARLALSEENTARSLATGDVDGDGRSDLLLAPSTGDLLTVRRAPTLDAGLPVRTPRLAAWIELADPAVGPIDLRPIEISFRIDDPSGRGLAAVELAYSVDGGGLWVPAVQVVGDLFDVRQAPGAPDPGIVWDWTTEGLPLDHPLVTDHPIDHDRLALRLRGVAGAPRTVAGPLVVTPVAITDTAELRRWPDEDHDGVPNRWDRCHQDPNGDSGGDRDGDGVCDTDDVCAGDDRELDQDGDGVCEGADCDDNDPQRRPGAAELCLDGVDNDCDGLVDLDDDTCGPADLGRTGLWCGSPEPVGAVTSSWLAALLFGGWLSRRRF